MFGGWAGEQLQVAVTLYTDAYVVRGTAATRQRRLSDLLNQAEDDFLILADVDFTEFGTGGVAYRAPYAQVNLGAVLFAVADGSVEPIPELRSPKVTETALISVPPFKITGRIHLLPERELRVALQELLGRFIPVTNARYWSDTAGAGVQYAPMVAVNHARAQILSPFDEGSAMSRPMNADGAVGAPDPG